ncbi:MAG: hypothetical protein QF890_10190 [Myxococcota bacterium]|nr:hypothetical protein [Myxococcota bacterium]MDP7300132.1 hypothetical protein [Myxococcota bacterium]MDP7432928.1 hypothetical protein [Myxococcota bacterium]HJO22663.1 hypothetical protein [Myxococcota bacterium]
MPARNTPTQGRFQTLLLVTAVCLTHAGVAGADDSGGEVVRIERTDAAPAEKRGWHHTPLQISLIPSAQIFPTDWTVTGVSFNMIYGEQKKVVGFDVGLFNNVTSELTGLQSGLVSIVEGNARGLQAGPFNRVGGSLHGLQIGIANRVIETLHGAQFGVANDAGSVTGAQVGVVNFANSLRGVQIGVANLNRAGTPFPFLPLVNVGW